MLDTARGNRLPADEAARRVRRSAELATLFTDRPDPARDGAVGGFHLDAVDLDLATGAVGGLGPSIGERQVVRATGDGR